MEFQRICLDIDGSVPLQKATAASMDHIVDLRGLEGKLRLWAKRDDAAPVAKILRTLRQRIPEPWLTFFGSGDLHHVSLLVLESLPESAKPLTLVLIDNHPDWFLDGRRYDCGNWVAALRHLPWISQIVILGQHSPDMNWYYHYTAPFQELCAGRIRLHPYSRERLRVPGRWARASSPFVTQEVKWWGTDITFRPLTQRGVIASFAEIAEDLSGQNVYLSIDKDSLAPQFALTDWDQGALTLDELLFAVEALSSSANLVGVDVTGERAPLPLSGFFKRIDCGRAFKEREEAPSASSIANNEMVNMAILSALSERSMKRAAP